MLLLILRALGEGEGRRDVAVGVAAARRGAGEDAGGDGAARDRDERLGARADQTVDGEHPAVGVALQQRPHETAPVGAGRDRADDVAGEHDLADLAQTDRLDGVVDGLLVALGGLPPGAERRRPVGPNGERGGRSGSGSSGVSANASRVTHARPPWRPTIVPAPAGCSRAPSGGRRRRSRRPRVRCRAGPGGRRSRRRRRSGASDRDGRVTRLRAGVPQRQQVAEAGERLSAAAPEQGIVARRVVQDVVHRGELARDDAQARDEVIRRLLHLPTVDRH